MKLQIKRTGIANYMPDGNANLKMMVIGGPGAGKTRFSSGWPDPFYLDCEAGLASVADLNVPYVEIDSSDDMLQALRWLQNDRQAKAQVGTVVVDTLDAFQRKVKQEWLDANPDESAFSGFGAWDYLDAKMQMLMTRLLSLPYNVIVLVHYKDKTITEKQGSNTIEKHLFTLQLQGNSKDTVFNDFDLIGWMGTYWKPGAEGEPRIQARGLTFEPTPEKPFLKDRLHITPKHLEVFLDSDHLYDNYANLFKRFTDRLDELAEGEDMGVIDAMDDDGNLIPETDAPTPVAPLKGGAVAPSKPKELPLEKLTKAQLLKMAKTMGLDDVKSNLLKDEVVQAIEEARAADASSASEEKAPEKAPEEAAADSTPVEDEAVVDEPDPVVEAVQSAEEDTTEGEEKDTSSDEPDLPSEEADADEEGDAPSEPAPAPAAESAPAEPAASEDGCVVCGVDLAKENQDYVKLAWIKYRERLCNEHYKARKQKG